MLKQRLLAVWRTVCRTASLMIGVPDYQGYVQHCQDHHPGGKIMSYEEFFRNRQESRYGDGKMGRCC